VREEKIHMGLLIPQERQALQETTGCYVKERCDGEGCKNVLTWVRYRKGTKEYCPECQAKLRERGEWRGGPKVPKVQKVTQQNTEEAEQMKTTKKSSSNGSEKVGGLYRPDSLRAVMFLALKDEKVHDMKDLAKVITKKKQTTDSYGLLQAVKRDGEKFNAWGISINGDQVQLKLGKGAAAAVAKAPKAPPAGKKTPAKQPPAPSSTAKEGKASGAAPALTKAQAATVSLVRKTLKVGGPWTRNKVVEELKTKSGIDQKAVIAAIDREISLGGVVQKKGQLSLA
jgi:hypothetical protein